MYVTLFSAGHDDVCNCFQLDMMMYVTLFSAGHDHRSDGHTQSGGPEHGVRGRSRPRAASAGATREHRRSVQSVVLRLP